MPKKRRVACVRCGRTKWSKVEEPRCSATPHFNAKLCNGLMIDIAGQMKP